MLVPTTEHSTKYFFEPSHDVGACIELKYSDECQIDINQVRNARCILVLGIKRGWDSSGIIVPNLVMALTFSGNTEVGIGLGWFNLSTKGGLLGQSMVKSLKGIIQNDASFFSVNSENSLVANKIMMYFTGRTGGRPDVHRELYSILRAHGGEANLCTKFKDLSKFIASKQKTITALAYDTAKVIDQEDSGEVNVDECKCTRVQVLFLRF